MTRKVFDPLNLPDHPLFTTHQVAQHLGTAISTINTWVDRGRLPGFRTPGGHRRIRRDDLVQFIQSYDYGIQKAESSNVLLLDTDNTIADAVSNALKKKNIGCSFTRTADAFTAGRIFGENPPDLVLINVDTPDINAWKSALQIASLSVSVTIVLFSKKCSVEDFARISEFKNVHLVSTEHGIHRAVKLISSFITPPHSNSDLIFRTVPSP